MDILYTSTNRIRGALGLSEKELDDAQIRDAGVEDQLLSRLARVFPGHAALQAAVLANTATAEQLAQWASLKLYVQFEGACCLLPQFQMLVVKRISDGDAENTRFGPDNLDGFMGHIQAKRDEYLRELNPDWYQPLAPAILGISVPGYDPVTDEGAL